MMSPEPPLQFEWGHRYRRWPHVPWHFIKAPNEQRARQDVADLLAGWPDAEVYLLSRVLITTPWAVEDL